MSNITIRELGRILISNLEKGTAYSYYFGSAMITQRGRSLLSRYDLRMFLPAEFKLKQSRSNPYEWTIKGNPTRGQVEDHLRSLPKLVSLLINY